MGLTDEARAVADRMIYPGANATGVGDRCITNTTGGLRLWEHLTIETLKALLAACSRFDEATNRPVIFDPAEALRWAERFADEGCELLAQRIPAEALTDQERRSGWGFEIGDEVQTHDGTTAVLVDKEALEQLQAGEVLRLRQVTPDEDPAPPDHLPTTGG